jgi:hypothetical protein
MTTTSKFSAVWSRRREFLSDSPRTQAHAPLATWTSSGLCLAVARRKGTTDLLPKLNSLYYCPERESIDRREKSTTIVEPFFSIMSATTLGYVEDLLGNAEIVGGTINRFLIIPAKNRSQSRLLKPLQNKRGAESPDPVLRFAITGKRTLAALGGILPQRRCGSNCISNGAGRGRIGIPPRRTLRHGSLSTSKKSPSFIPHSRDRPI